MDVKNDEGPSKYRGVRGRVEGRYVVVKFCWRGGWVLHPPPVRPNTLDLEVPLGKLD